MRKNDKRGMFATLSPVIIWMALFFVIPIMFVVAISFFTRGEYGDIQYKFTLSNYGKIFNPEYIKIFADSLAISLLTTILCLLFGYPFAYFVAKAGRKFRAMLLMLIIVPFWTNSLVRSYAWITLLRTQGFINSYLMKLGIIHTPITMLYNNTAVLIGMVYTLFPFMVFPLYASIEKLDDALLEASGDLGASPLNSFLKVTLPLTMSGIVAGSLLVFIPTLGYFFIPDLMGGSRTMLISNLIKNQFLTSRNWPLGSALSIVLIVFTFVLIGIYLRLTKSKDRAEVF